MSHAERLRAALVQARETMRDFAENYDHDEDAHRYRTSCRVCDAETEKAKIDAVLAESEPDPKLHKDTHDISALHKTIPDEIADLLSCGDNSCMFGFAVPRGGMGTNGGCRCFEVSTREEVRVLRRKVAHAINYARTEQAGFKAGVESVWGQTLAALLRAKTLPQAKDEILALRAKTRKP